MDLFKDVGNFHAKFGLPHLEDNETGPTLLADDVQEFREDFLREELDEFMTAHIEGDLAKAADALCDLVYVALGTAHLMGIPFNECWAEVQRANMTKERANGGDDSRSKRKHVLDVVKPEGWEPPDIEGVLRREGAVL